MLYFCFFFTFIVRVTLVLILLSGGMLSSTFLRHRTNGQPPVVRSVIRHKLCELIRLPLGIASSLDTTVFAPWCLLPVSSSFNASSPLFQQAGRLLGLCFAGFRTVGELSCYSCVVVVILSCISVIWFSLVCGFCFSILRLLC